MNTSLKRKLNKAIKETKDFASGETKADFSFKRGARNMCPFCGKGHRYRRPHKRCLELSTRDLTQASSMLIYRYGDKRTTS